MEYMNTIISCNNRRANHNEIYTLEYHCVIISCLMPRSFVIWHFNQYVFPMRKELIE